MPQGPVLGPLLFLIYVNAICKSSEILPFILFADDTNLFLSHQDSKPLNNAMNQALEKVTLWLAANKLSLNVGKTYFMIFKSKNKNVPHKVTVNIAGENIKQVDHTKFLGIYIDEKLCWKFHINYVSMKVSKIVGIIATARHYLELKIIHTWPIVTLTGPAHIQLD